MPYLLERVLLALACLWCSPAWSLPPVAQPIVLGNAGTAFDVTSDIATWIEPGTQATVADVASAPERFAATPALQRQPLSQGQTLWVRLRLVRAAGTTDAWTLNIPLPFLDFVTLYQPDGRGGWTTQSAGDTLAQSEWSRRGMYPDFDLTLAPNQPVDVFLQVRNFKHLSMPLRLATAQEREAQRELEWVAVGLILGALLTLVVLSLVRYAEHRNHLDRGAAWFGILILATVAQFNGVLNALLWSQAPEIGDYANSVMPVVAVGCSLLFMRRLYVLSVHHHRYDAFLASTAWAAIASVISYAVLDRAMADRIGALVLFFVTAVGMVATLLSWREGASIWRWLALAYLPQFLGLLRLVAEAAGVVPTMWEMRYLSSLSVALSVPAMVYALNLVTHDRKELVVRTRHLPTQDALTGLLTQEAFLAHVEQACTRAQHSGEPAALVKIRIVNFERIRQAFGDTTAEQCLLRAVVKLHRILESHDHAGRVDSASFAVLVEGHATREAVRERMVKLIASGLIPLPGLEPEVMLQFHAACVLLHDNPMDATQALAELDAVLAGMSSRTRRPVRFLEQSAAADSSHLDTRALTA